MEENKHIYNAFDIIKEAILVSLWKYRTRRQEMTSAYFLQIPTAAATHFYI